MIDLSGSSLRYYPRERVVTREVLDGNNRRVIERDEITRTETFEWGGVTYLAIQHLLGSGIRRSYIVVPGVVREVTPERGNKYYEVVGLVGEGFMQSQLERELVTKGFSGPVTFWRANLI